MANATRRGTFGGTPFGDYTTKRGAVSTAQVFYTNCMIGLNTSGYADKMDDAASKKFDGLLASAQVEVLSGGSNGDVLLDVSQPRFIWGTIAAAVVGDVGRKVYASYDNTLTYTPGTYGNLVGTVAAYINATTIVVECEYDGKAANRKLGGCITLAATGTETLSKYDLNKIVFVPNTAAKTINLPAVANAQAGDRILFIKTTNDAYAFTLDGNSSETINGATTLASGTDQYDSIEVVCDGDEWFALGGTDSMTVITFTGATGVNEIHIPTNLADALSVEDSAGNTLEIYDTTTGALVKTVNMTVKQGASGSSELAGVKGTYVSGTISVAVPSITDPDIAKVDVDLSGMTFAPAIGDAVIAIPLEALPTNARLQGAWISATDTCQVTFGSEGGNVTGANKNFKFLILDLT